VLVIDSARFIGQVEYEFIFSILSLGLLLWFLKLPNGSSKQKVGLKYRLQ